MGAASHLQAASRYRVRTCAAHPREGASFGDVEGAALGVPAPLPKTPVAARLWCPPGGSLTSAAAVDGRCLVHSCLPGSGRPPAAARCVQAGGDLHRVSGGAPTRTVSFTMFRSMVRSSPNVWRKGRSGGRHSTSSTSSGMGRAGRAGGRAGTDQVEHDLVRALRRQAGRSGGRAGAGGRVRGSAG